MLTITPDAATAIKSLVEHSEMSEGGGLRIYAEPVDDSQASLELSLSQGPGPGDQVLEAEGATVYLEQAAASFLEDKKLDATVEDENVQFSIEEAAGTG